MYKLLGVVPLTNCRTDCKCKACMIAIINNSLITIIVSSVAWGGSSPPIGLQSMQNRTFLVLLRPIFGEKMKTAPPKENSVPKLWINVVIRPEKAFEIPILVENSVLISVKTFFFWRSPVFGLKKRLKFRFWSKTPSWFRWRPFFWRSPVLGLWISDFGRKIL